MDWLQQIVHDCAAKENAPDSVIEELYTGKVASTYEAKCVRACIGETIGFVSFKFST